MLLEIWYVIGWYWRRQKTYPDFTSMKWWSTVVKVTLQGVCNNLKHWETRMDLNGRWESLCHVEHQICFRRGLGKPTHLLRAETLAEIFLWVECPKIPTCVAHVPSGVSDVYCLQCITWLFEQLPFISGVVLVSRPSLLPNLTCLFSSGWICVFAGDPLDCLFSQL